MVRKMLESLKEKFYHRAPIAFGALAMCAIVAGFASGNAQAAVGNETVAYYGLSLVDWFLVVIGSIMAVIGCYLRDIRVIGIGTVVLILGGVANYLGV
jgi:hypothetical protein